MSSTKRHTSTGVCLPAMLDYAKQITSRERLDWFRLWASHCSVL